MSHVSGKPAKDAKSEKSGGKSPRRRARELALQGLYQWRIGGNDEAAIEAHLADVEGCDTEQLQAFLDRPFAELSPIEASILLAGAFELANYQQTPYRVIINEAIELTKGFGGTDGHKYVNGVLDKLAFKLRPVEVEAKRAERRG